LQAFVPNGDQMYGLPTFRYYSSSQDKPRFLTANVEDDIMYVQAFIGCIGYKGIMASELRTVSILVKAFLQ
jgi:hypothetical protein